MVPARLKAGHPGADHPFMFGLMTIVSAGRALAHFERASVVDELGATVSRSEGDRLDRAEQMLTQTTTVWFVLLLVTAIAAMAFLYRATANLRSFGHRERSGPVWAVFSWMIPIVNLYLPKRMGAALLAVSAFFAILVFRSIAARHTERAEVLRQAHPTTAPAHGVVGG